MYIINFSFLKKPPIFVLRGTPFSPLLFPQVFSSHFPRTFLSQNPSKCSLEFDARATRRASFAKLARSGGEAKITPLSRNSQALSAFPSHTNDTQPQLGDLASIQCIVGYAIENTLKTHLSSTNQRWNWGRCRPHFSDSSRSTIRDEIFRRAFPADNNRLIIQTLIISKKWSTFQPGDDFYPLYCFISYSIFDYIKQDL